MLDIFLYTISVKIHSGIDPYDGTIVLTSIMVGTGRLSISSSSPTYWKITGTPDGTYTIQDSSSSLFLEGNSGFVYMSNDLGIYNKWKLFLNQAPTSTQAPGTKKIFIV